MATRPTLFGRTWTHGKVQSVLVEANKEACRLSREAELAGIKTIALDEMFSPGRPVLVGIDLDPLVPFNPPPSPREVGLPPF